MDPQALSLLSGALADRRRFDPREAVALAGLLALFVTFTVPMSRRWSQAYDEPIHIRTGIAMLTGGRDVDPAAAWWTALDPLAPPADALPGGVALAAGQSADFRSDPYPSFGAVCAARWVNHVLGMATLLLIYGWARQVWRSPAAGWIAAALAGFHPLFLAHSSIVSPDLYAAFGAALAGWVTWAAAESIMRGDATRRAWAIGIAASGVALTVATLCKISNLVLIPLAPAMALLMARSRVGMRRAAIFCVGATLAAGALTAAAYQVLIDPVLWSADSARAAGRIDLLSVMKVARSAAATHGEVFFSDAVRRASIKVFAAAYLLKTPLPMICFHLLIPGAVALCMRDPELRRRAVGPLAVALAAGLFFCLQGVYVGLRSLLAPMTLYCVCAGALIRAHEFMPELNQDGIGEGERRRIPLSRLLPVILLALAAGDVIRWSPWTMSYFNPLARSHSGEPRRLPRLVDSDSDWGQGLIELARWQKRYSPDRPVYLAYFGNARPEDFGVNYIGLPSPYSWTRRDLPNPTAAELMALDGVVAISATHTAGMYLGAAGLPMDYYSRAFARPPDASLAGGTILIFDERRGRS